VKLSVLAALLVAAGIGNALVSPELESRLAAQAGQYLPVHVVLKEQFDAGLLNSLVEGLPKPQRRAEVARILREYSDEKQAAVIAELGAGGARNITPLWIVNAVYCEATSEQIRQVAARPDVDYVSYDLAYSPDLLEEPGAPAPPSAEIPWGVQRINAPAVWAQGYTGQGIVLGIIDTGCDYTHPDFADHLWADSNYPHSGWDFENNDNDPMDDHGHGTMTAGFVGSDGTDGSQCGAAPDAELMICRVRTMADSISESQVWAAMQFCVAPPLSPASGADLYVTTLGWLISWNPHQATLRTTMNNVLAAGLTQIVSAGSEGDTNTPYNLRCPGNVPPPWWNPENTGTGVLSGAVTCGVTDSLDIIVDFSSQGPVTWSDVAPFNDYAYPPGLTKPEVVAPGINVKTTRRGGGYTEVSGTSWATAYVAGAVALMLSKDSMLSPAAVDSLLETSAVDLGPSGKDNAYGAGRIDVLAAMTGVAEAGSTPNARRLTLKAEPNPFRSVCRVSPAAPVEVLDASGRRVATVTSGVWRPGASICPGVYFVRTRSAVGGQRSALPVTYIR
jgi:serine protease AprX